MVGENRVVPADVMKEMQGKNTFSLFDYVFSDTFAYFYTYTTIFLAVLFTLGVYTRYVSIALLLMFWNLLQGISFYCFGFDFYTFQVLFWAAFLPLDNFFSLKKSSIRKPSLSISIAFLVQIAWIYFATGIAKYGQSWQGGYAIRNMLLDIAYIKPMATFFVDSPLLYKPLTYMTLLFEYATPLLLFIPVKNHIGKYLMVGFLLGFHFFIFAMSNVGNFSISGLSVALLLLPKHFWEQVFNEGPLRFENLNKETKVFSYLKYGFVIVAVYVISISNLVFFTKYSALKTKENAKELEELVSKFIINSPVKTSFFLQHWKMFAPNPPMKGGWVTIEYTSKTDGYNYDLFTGSLVTDTETKPALPYKGVEYYLMNYARGYVYSQEGRKIRIFLKYWYPKAIINRGFDFEKEKDNFKFVDYAFEITDQSKPFTPQIQKIVIPSDVVINNEYKNLITE